MFLFSDEDKTSQAAVRSSLPVAALSFDERFQEADSFRSIYKSKPVASTAKKLVVPSLSYSSVVVGQTNPKNDRRTTPVPPTLVQTTQPTLAMVEETVVQPARLVSSQKRKEQILGQYSQKFAGDSHKRVVTEKQGEHQFIRDTATLPSRDDWRHPSFMRSKHRKYYRVSTLSSDHVMLPLFAGGFLDLCDYENLRQVSTNHRKLVQLHLRLLDTDLNPVFEPREDYASQEEISLERVDMNSALFIHLGGEPGSMVRALGNEYVLSELDRRSILDSVRGHVSQQDYDSMERILFEGCPAEFHLEEDNADRLKWILRGNQATYNARPDLTRKALNKEEKQSHVIPMDAVLLYFSPYCRHTPQGLIDKKNKKVRIVWDGSTIYFMDDVAMNAISPTELEAPITFGSVEADFDSYLYNLRVSYPNENILLAWLDIAACFRFPRIHPDLSGAFGFLANDSLYCLANAMVFGHVTSASSWEPFRRAIQALSKVYANREDLVEKHKDLLNMLKWDDNPQELYVPAAPCALNPGVINADGNERPPQSRFYVDDALLAAINRWRMMLLLAATIEAIFTIMGSPNLARRQSALAKDKWEDLTVGAKQIMLGMQYDTVKLTKGSTSAYRVEVLELLLESWPDSRETFTANDAQKLVGKLARLAKAARWVHHVLSHMYDEIAVALATNRNLLKATSPQFRQLVTMIKQGNHGHGNVARDAARITSFALKKAARLIHRSKQQYRISPSMREIIHFFRNALQGTSSVQWSSPLGHIILRSPSAKLYGDSSLRAAGGYSLGLRFWWHLSFPDSIIQRTLLFLPDDSSGQLISINALEFATIILNYCAALTVYQSENPTDDPFPVVLAITDNTSAMNWINHACKRSPIGKALGRFFVGLLMHSRVGINSEWISTDENEIADEISRLKRASTSTNIDAYFDYSTLPQRFPALAHCRRWEPSQALVSTIWSILLYRRYPTLEQTATLKHNGLGRVIT